MEEASQEPLERFNSLLKVVRKADNDNEKFASLLIITKMVKADVLTQQQRKKLFQALGLSFPLKLIANNDESDTSQRQMLSNLGFSLLSAYSSVEDLLCSPELERAIPLTLRVLEKCLELPDSSEDHDAFDTNDCMQFLTAVATTDIGCKSILRHNGLRTLVTLFNSVAETETILMLWCILIHLSNYDGSTVWEDDKDIMLVFLENVSLMMKNNTSAETFELMSQLTCLLNTCPLTSSEFYFNHSWIDNIATTVLNVLCSRVSSEQRNPTLKLCHCLTEKYKFKWTCRVQDKNLASLLTRLALVEIKMLFFKKDAGGTEWESEEMSLLLSCFALFEAACSHIAEYDQERDGDYLVFSFQDIQKLCNSLQETVSLVVEKPLSALIETGEATHFLTACLRMIGSWLNVEYFATSEEGLKIVTPALSAFKLSVKLNPYDSVKAFTPALLHYIDHPRTKSTVIDSKIMSILCELLYEHEQNLPLEPKVLICQCLMALCLETENAQQFQEILSFLMEKSIKETNLIIMFYTLTLSLMLWNKCATAMDSISLRDRLFKKLVTLLHGVHATKGSSIEVSKKYLDIWEDVDQLWFIMVKEFIRAAQSNKGIANIAVETPFPEKVKTLLTYCADSSTEPALSYGLLDVLFSSLN
ncbi:unnamed protein product [Clavelina lepadiformis]|uniref:Neurochondrin n=1 Tax=Clavelina lepadiformis TaxID=159417 RepID=A0ABP0FWV2_CLALP